MSFIQSGPWYVILGKWYEYPIHSKLRELTLDMQLAVRVTDVYTVYWEAVEMV